ncbi:protein kinase [Aspergillus unguis]
MAFVMQRLSRIFKPFLRHPLPARNFPLGPLLDPNYKVDEEKLEWYSREAFLPIKIGDVFQSKYQVVGKLGYGGYSTVWLCRDLQEHAYVTLKLYEHDSPHAEGEIRVYEHLQGLQSSHTGSILVRTMLDKFYLSSSDGSKSYQCLIHPPLGMSLFELRNRTRGKVFPENLLKPTVIHILLALDFLHTGGGVIHSDIQEKNIMLNVEDESILVDFEQAELSGPSPRKTIDDVTIYPSRKLGIPKKHGRPVLADFGEARFGSETGAYSGEVQPFMYRAPEVLLRMPWNEKIDIWNLGVLTWDLFERGHLFYAQDANERPSDIHHLAEMIAYLGLPPQEMLVDSEYASEFFDSNGQWKGLAKIPSTTLESIEGNLQGDQQEGFLRFVRKMLQWRPGDRATAKEFGPDLDGRAPIT